MFPFDIFPLRLSPFSSVLYQDLVVILWNHFFLRPRLSATFVANPIHLSCCPVFAIVFLVSCVLYLARFGVCTCLFIPLPVQDPHLPLRYEARTILLAFIFALPCPFLFAHSLSMYVSTLFSCINTIFCTSFRPSWTAN